MNATTQVLEKLIDQEARDRFAQEIDHNFSVIAPAGVGKTTAIVQRIITIAASTDYQTLPSKLSKLIVVTYTQKAADEMKMRAYQALMHCNGSMHAFVELNKAFFGTIHSFCLKLVQSYGSSIGIPNNLTLLTNDEELWREFLNSKQNFLNLIPEKIQEDLNSYINFDKLLHLAHKLSLDSLPTKILPNCPKTDLTDILKYTSTRSAQKVTEIQKALQVWLREWQENPIALGIPEVTQGDSVFKELCSSAFSPLWNWVGEAGHMFAWNVAKEYQNYRLSKGFVTYDDMIDLAEKLIKDSSSLEAIRLLDYHIILDEAQDTDAKQFAVLLGVVQPNANAHPLGGRFSMVGDPQQAIYSSRADLPTYLKVHHDLLSSSAAQELTFNVTMRCDRAIVTHCNALFPNILKNKINTSQIDFVSLNARPWAHDGFVGKIVLQLPDNKSPKWTNNDLENYEAQLLANKLQSLGLEALEISDWSELAILVPRKNWLIPIKKALDAIGLPLQIHSGNDIKGDNPAFAWITALLAIMISPNNSFEIVGVLREIFGLSDDAIAHYVHQSWDKHERHPLNISSIHNVSKENPTQKNPIEEILQSLSALRCEIFEYSLSEAVHCLIAKTNLRNRLLSLSEQNYDYLLDIVDEILMEATLTEEQGLSIAEFFDHLKKDFYNLDEPLTVLKGHIQGFTSHKAKGLEWPVVIVPFLFRGILFPSQEYPQMMHLGNVSGQKVVISNHPDKKQFDELLEKHRIAELERLLYVTATRPRHKLLWVDDEALFDSSKISFASLLNITSGNPNRQIWNQLTPVMPIVTKKISHQQFPINKEEINVTGKNTSASNPKSFDLAIIDKASDYSKRILKHKVPSQFSRKIERPHSDKNDPDQKSNQQYSAIDYGNWWHNMMQYLPWKTHSEWSQYFSERLQKCPDPIRGEQEIELFYKSASLKALLKDSHSHFIQTECPFLYQEENNLAYEGYIDFFALCELTNRILIIDWKTDLIDKQGAAIDFLEILKSQYEPQLRIYKKAVEKAHRNKVSIFLYSTSIGALVELAYTNQYL